jgi:cobalt-zinc-cadmium efflux system membrane fusion protein
MRTLLFITGMILFFTACHHQGEEKDVPQYRLQGEYIIIPEGSAIGSKLKTDTASRAAYRQEIYSAARITAIPTKYAEIAPPFNGRIMASFITLGQNVIPGTPLFSINAPDFTDAQKLYLQAKQQYMLAEKEYKRQHDLLDHGVGVQRDMEAAKTNFEVTKSEYEKSRESIRVFGADPDKMVFGQPLIVRSPIKGQVINNKLVVGKYLTDNSAPILTVAELSTVWITGTVKEKDIRFIHEGDMTTATVTAYPGEVFMGKVYHIDEVVDEETHAINVLIVCDNKNGQLKPGMYASVKFTDAPREAVFVPATALLQLNDKHYVFLQEAPGRYRKQFVSTGALVNGKAVITDGLNGSEVVITEGGFYLQDAK